MVAGIETTLEPIQEASLVVVIVEPLKVAKPQEHYSRENKSLKISRPGFLFLPGHMETVKESAALTEMPLCVIQKTNIQTLFPSAARDFEETSQ